MDTEPDKIEKPSNWPANGRECALENISKAIEEFKKNPNYKNKEIMTSLVSQTDLNESNGNGIARVTAYEISVVNQLYWDATFLIFGSLKILLYRQIANTARIQKMVHQMSGYKVPLEVEEYRNLLPPLYIFYLAYANFNIKKTNTFINQLIEEMNIIVNESTSDEDLIFISEQFNLLLYDLSRFPSAKLLGILKWNRDELYKIFSLQAELIKKTGADPLIRPLKGVLIISISNWILKSRNNYNEDYLCKYVSDNASASAFFNNEIWTQDIKFLNDKREQVVIKELFEDKSWIEFDWANEVDLAPVRKSYVSSFSKAVFCIEMQKEYGKNMYGYKNDRIGEVLSPVYLNKNKYPRLGQVMSYDIIYGTEEAKNELNYLFSIVDLYVKDDETKNAFLNELIQYWRLSFKDEEWKNERERRYELFIHDEYDYLGLDIDEQFLKMKSTLFTHPDFVSKENNNHESIRINRIDKIRAIANNPHIFCEDCLQADYDQRGSPDDNKCSICGSTNTKNIDRYP